MEQLQLSRITVSKSAIRKVLLRKDFRGEDILQASSFLRLNVTFVDQLAMKYFLVSIDRFEPDL